MSPASKPVDDPRRTRPRRSAALARRSTSGRSRHPHDRPATSPEPIPSSKRPAETWSRVTACLARSVGLPKCHVRDQQADPHPGRGGGPGRDDRSDRHAPARTGRARCVALSPVHSPSKPASSAMPAHRDASSQVAGLTFSPNRMHPTVGRRLGGRQFVYRPSKPRRLSKYQGNFPAGHRLLLAIVGPRWKSGLDLRKRRLAFVGRNWLFLVSAGLLADYLRTGDVSRTDQRTVECPTPACLADKTTETGLRATPASSQCWTRPPVCRGC